MQLKISQVRVGAFVLNKFILRNLLYWWRSSFMVIITRETFLPARSCPCATDVDAVIWTVGQQAGFAWFLDAVCTLSCYKIMFKIICWRSATHCVAFCSIFYLCRVPNLLYFTHIPPCNSFISALSLFLFIPDTCSFLRIFRNQARKLALWG